MIVTDQKLKSYFLGTLAAAEAERLEEECSTDTTLSEQAEIVEMELTDDYLRTALSAAESRLFEESYLTTEARRNKLRSAKNLWKAAHESEKTVETKEPSFLQTLFANYKTPAFGALAAFVILGGFAFVWINFNKTPEISRTENSNEAANSVIDNKQIEIIKKSNADGENSTAAANYSDNNNSPANYNSPKNANNTPKSNAAPESKETPKTIRQTAPTFAAFVLLPGTLRSEGEQFIKIPPKTEKINLQFTLPKDAVKYRIYRATLKTADGETIFAAPNLKSPNFVFRAENLEDRTYIVFLEGLNSPGQIAESVAEYAFRVRR